MKALFILFFVLALVSETLQGVDARSLLSLKERQLSDTVHKDNTATAMDATKSTSTTNSTTTSSSTTSTASSAKTHSSPPGSFTDAKAGSTSTADGNQHDQSNDDDFWGAPTEGQTHHMPLDYNHPKKSA
ncbi:hypothetical protein CDL15_Pgr016616 [Punica granatum]|uniref:Uncharacterized protein n=1 Tax=Punica granatum TaxID=22663 RepID=A0A218XSW2_PUNGR|nr:hypothetical protein CDL15_Pgr016616 [Punica granatum]